MKYKLLIRLFIYRAKMKAKAISQKISRIFKKRIELQSFQEGRFVYKKLRKSFNIKRPSFYIRKEHQRNNSLRYDQVLAKRKREKKANSKLFSKYRRCGKTEQYVFVDGEIIEVEIAA